jgi:hypothetical protein
VKRLIVDALTAVGSALAPPAARARTGFRLEHTIALMS